MIAGLLLAAAAVAQPPVEQAERAFASAAQTGGQWAAFRTFAAPDAMMLLEDRPQPALPFLAKLKEPAQPVMWWPARTVTSCDGSLAYSTGPWRRRGGTQTGRYNTIWRNDGGEWRWIFDGGSDATADEQSRGIVAGDQPKRVPARRCGRPIWPAAEPGAVAGGASRDDTLRWRIDRLAKDSYRLRVWFNAGRAPLLVADTAIS